MFRKLTALLVMVVLLLATAAPAFAARPFSCTPGGSSFFPSPNCGLSLDHRSNASGKGNFGQCHKIEFFAPLQDNRFSSLLNPSAQSPYEADCRAASGRTKAAYFYAAAICEPPLEPAAAEGKLIFQPRLDAEIISSGCR
jgi:hypothetical protein